ncbi:4-aminobutyrate--2-oxoglutarate transaminase [Granulosicoccus sp.]|nr:4-aminobutyrate--2-oxoglutarate transaminase [Granulosicoccus sp.]MDB4223684.1 4-aminobutyrate--2-oxoglutarate transaminase [Granulosicoccus sp.]
MSNNSDFDKRRDKAVARAIAFTSTFTAERAENAEIWDVEGNRYIDFCGGIGCQNIGHRHPQVVAAIEKQLKQLTHTCFQIVPYESYISLAERINALAPGGYEKKSLFFSSGGEAVENAIKIARHYTRKPAIITFTNGYHGRSYMGMGLSSRMSPFKEGFRPFPTEIYRVPFPDDYHGVSHEQAISAIDTLLKTDADADSIGAVIFEPVQGEGGYNIVQGKFLQWLRVFCDQHNIVLIADEIQTGCGRTGKMFASEHFGVAPDLTCIGKSIGGGLPLSGIVGRADIIDSVPPGGLGGTFGGNPLGCAAALAVLDVIAEENLLERGVEIGKRIGARFNSFVQDPALTFVGDARSLGAMNAIEIVKDRASREPDGDRTAAIIKRALDKGLILLSAGADRNIIRILVPLTASFELIDEGLDIMESVIRAG